MATHDSDDVEHPWFTLLLDLKTGAVASLLTEIGRHPYLRPNKDQGSRERGFADFVAIFARMQHKGFGRLIPDDSGDWHEIEHALGQIRWRGTGCWSESYRCQGTFDLMIDGELVLHCFRTASPEKPSALSPAWQIDWVAAGDQEEKATIEKALGWLPGGYRPPHSED